MDIYSKKSQWKVYLAVVGVIIVLISVVYTNHLANQLADEEAKKIKQWELAQAQISDIDDPDWETGDFTLHNMILTENSSIPVILVDDRDKITAAVNFGINRNEDDEYLKEQVVEMREDGFEPIKGFAYEIYYKESNILQQLRYFPFVQLLLIGAFILFGYLGFNTARIAEQNRVWVGMAKETAHQLGTPISAILAWIEHLKLIREKDDEVIEVVGELRNDVNRLELVADRFSKIGSEPKLDPANVYEKLEECRAYMQRRASRRVNFQFPDPGLSPKTIFINAHLFNWVIENLLRNALDAMGGKGQISADVYDDRDYVYIDIKDTGKGIPNNKFKRVFQPGFTTKKRGWGLGLSLAKRIIEDYHSGKIWVKDSEVDKGTTFAIALPKSAE
ncbi:MAG: HAMP domain-containing sensor histidine kinase [Bacteroidota bacterium]